MPIPEGTGPISKVLTRERVLVTIRGWIVSGTLAPGEDIRDGELAEALGVSRSPVRVTLVELPAPCETAVQYERHASAGRYSDMLDMLRDGPLRWDR